MSVIETRELGKRYGRLSALAGCTVTIPEGHFAALVGPNGAGKSTLLNLVVGLAAPSAGEVSVLGGLPAGSPAALDGIAFVAQDMPLYRHLSAADMIHLTRNLNQAFDDAYARHRLQDLAIAPTQKTGRLSGGQRAQLALTLALARHPRLLVLDEPTAALDPLARHDFMATVMTAMAEDGVSVLLSSHGLAELERVADYLILIAHGRVRLDGAVEDLLGGHSLLTGPRGPAPRPPVANHPRHQRRRPEPPPRSSADGQLDAAGLGGPGGQPRGNDDGLPARRRQSRTTDTGRDDPMSATALAAVPSPRVRPIPWRRLAWVTWRRQRTTILATLALLGLLAIYLVVTGLQMRSAWHTVQACTPQRSRSCIFEWTNFKDTYSNPGIFNALFIFAPLLIGAFAGAPLIGRELETGTFRYAWTQGVGRVRWAVALLVPGAISVAALAGVIGALIAWHDRPLWEADIVTRLAPGEFPATGLAIAGWSLAAYGVGVLAGFLSRRVLPALAAALAISIGLGFVASNLRPTTCHP